MVRLIRRNDHESLSELYRRYGQRLLGYFIKMFRGDVPKAQDFLQDLFVKVLERKDQFNPQRKFYTWVFTIASNMCKTDFRNISEGSLDSAEEYSLKVENDEQLDRRRMNEILRIAVHSLEHHHKVTFILRYIEGFSLKETAEITEASIGTVKSRLFYATRKLAEQLKEYKSDTIKK